MANFVWDSTDNISVSEATCCTGGRDPTHTPDSWCRAAERRESNKWSPAQPLQTHIMLMDSQSLELNSLELIRATF